MRLSVRRLSVAVLLVALALSLPLDAQLAPRNCTWRCNREYSGDSASCVSTRVLGQGNCRVVANCNIVIVDPDGPFGPASPSLQWLCSYDCAFDTCIWI